MKGLAPLYRVGTSQNATVPTLTNPNQKNQEEIATGQSDLLI